MSEPSGQVSEPSGQPSGRFANRPEPSENRPLGAERPRERTKKGRFRALDERRFLPPHPAADPDDRAAGHPDHRRNARQERYPALTARDAVHAAVVQLHGLRAICSYDKDFDQVEGVERIEPPLEEVA
ncbi:MAG TPA: PIN domain-containing protein [Thermoanaerobaculia bacterium]|nr:PIN domain-containing protein [Thermoanaerobaculia bacterium]